MRAATFVGIGADLTRDQIRAGPNVSMEKRMSLAGSKFEPGDPEVAFGEILLL